MTATPLLSIQNLTINYIGAKSDFRAVDDVSLDIASGEVFGLAGESGCGKSTSAYAINRLHKPPSLVRQGRMLFEGQNVLDLDDKALRKFHWHKVAMVFKSAMNSLNPVLHVETQLHDRHQGRAKADWLAILMSPDPKSLMRAAEARKRPYPRSSL